MVVDGREHWRLHRVPERMIRPLWCRVRDQFPRKSTSSVTRGTSKELSLHVYLTPSHLSGISCARWRMEESTSPSGVTLLGVLTPLPPSVLTTFSCHLFPRVPRSHVMLRDGLISPRSKVITTLSAPTRPGSTMSNGEFVLCPFLRERGFLTWEF